MSEKSDGLKVSIESSADFMVLGVENDKKYNLERGVFFSFYKGEDSKISKVSVKVGDGKFVDYQSSYSQNGYYSLNTLRKSLSISNISSPFTADVVIKIVTEKVSLKTIKCC